MIKKIFFLLNKKEQTEAYKLLLLVTLFALLDVFGVASIMPFMATVGDPTIIESDKFLNYLYICLKFTNSQSFIFFLGIIVMIFLISSLTFKAYVTYVQLRFNLLREHSIGKRLIESYLNQPYTWFLNNHSSNLVNKILSEVNQVVGSAVGPFILVVSHGILAIAMISLLIFVDPTMSLVVGLTFGTIYLIIYFAIRKSIFNTGLKRVEANKSRFRSVSEAFNGVKEIKLAGLEKVYIKKFSRSAKLFAESHASIQTLVQIPRFVAEGFAFVGMILVVLFFLSGNDGFSSGLPVVAVYALAGYRLMPSLQMVYSSIATLRSSLAALDVLYEDLKSLPSFEDNDVIKSEFKLRKKISLKNIYAKYPFAKKMAINGISVEIPVKKTIGFVGTSGSGKTTTIDLILGLLELKSGSFSVDGTEINKSNLKEWQRIIGYVPQEIFLIDDNIAANIAFGLSKNDIDMQAVEHASKIANLHDFVVNELNEGYLTEVGERGVRLSGGQRQRIGIARALYHNPQLLVLDEATSALDNVTENEVMEAVNSLCGDITIIIIAHRISTVSECDTIYLLQNGKVVAEGTYDELLKNNKEFKNMVEI